MKIRSLPFFESNIGKEYLAISPLSHLFFSSYSHCEETIVSIHAIR